MIFASPFIAAFAVPVSGSCKHEGFGRVERRIDLATYVISMGREKMTVKVTEGALAAGQRVSVTVREEGLLITSPVSLAGEATASKGADDAFLKGALWFGEGKKPSLDAVIDGLASGTCVDIRRSKALFEALAPGLEAVNPELTRTIKKLFSALAASPPGESLRAETVRAAIELVARLRGECAEAAVPQPGRFFVLQRAIPDGVYRFTEIEDALALLGAHGPSGEKDGEGSFTQEIERRLAENGAAVIRTIACGKDETAAVSLRPDDVPREFESLSRRFTSRAFQSIPLSCFEQLFNERAVVRFHTVRQLDQLAATLHLPAATARAGSREAQEAALVQWLHTALDGRCSAAALSATLPTFSAASIVDSLEELAAAAAGLPPSAVSLPSAQQVAVTKEAVMETDRKQVLGLAYKRLGCDLERSLALSGTADTGSLKAQLLELAGSIDAPSYTDVRPAGETETHAPETVEAEIIGKINEFERTCLSLIDQTIGSGAESLHPESSGDAAPVRERERFAERAQRDLSALVRARLAELKALIGEIMRASGESLSPCAEDAASPCRAAVSRIEALLVSFKNDLEGILRRFSFLPEQGTAPDKESGKPGQPKAFLSMGRVVAALETCLVGLFRNLDDFRPPLVHVLETLFGDLTREIVRSAADGGTDNFARPDAALSPLHDTEAPARRAMRRSIETLLNRVESLQLLARQVPTIAGDQHIVALPIKIGNEWTEMHVRFVRRRGRKGSAEGRANFTVYINVAPSLLGAISTRIEYHRNKSFSAVMGFESDDTRAWFVSRKGDVRKALQAQGAPSPRIEFLRIPGARPARTILETGKTASNSTIDVKA